MRRLTQLDAPLDLTSPVVVTAGTFDGMHQGHRAILETVCVEAEQRSGSSVAITFDKHPRSVLTPESAPPLLMSREEKHREIESTGIDLLIEIPFTLAFSRTSPEDFIEKFHVRLLSAAFVVVGVDHGFGRDRKGNAGTMKELGSRFGFEVIEVGARFFEGIPISSTRVRSKIAGGEVEAVPRLLGRSYGMIGEVVPGDRRGREIGFPTANLKPDEPDKLLPGDGVYVVRAKIDTAWVGGVANIGTRPTFDGEGRGVEVHLLDFSGDLYGRQVELEFLYRLRNEKKFSSVSNLISQIQEDVKSARSRLHKMENRGTGSLVSKIA